jgi:hypothetical protein
MCPRIASFNVLVSTYIIATASTRTANLIDCNFHTIRYLLLILHTPRGAPDNADASNADFSGFLLSDTVLIRV